MLHERALKGYEASLGVDHPDTLRTAQAISVVTAGIRTRKTRMDQVS